MTIQLEIFSCAAAPNKSMQAESRQDFVGESFES